MSEKIILIIFVLFLAFISLCMAIDTYTFSQLRFSCSPTPSVSASDTAHTKILYADGSGCVSTFIPEFLR
jgi:hypothetical protein